MTTWKIDPMHSEVQFKVKHLMISTVTGDFGQYDATLESETDEVFEGAKVSFEADINAINTNNEQRDGHLKSADFFDAENFPKLQFESTSFTNKGGNDYELVGNLNIKGTAKPVTLDVTFGGTMVDFYGNLKAGFDISGKISRKEFGLTWDGVTEAGGVVVSDEVRLLLNIQMTKVS